MSGGNAHVLLDCTWQSVQNVSNAFSTSFQRCHGNALQQTGFTCVAQRILLRSTITLAIFLNGQTPANRHNLFRQIAFKYGFVYVTNSPRNLKSNGKAEMAFQIVTLCYRRTTILLTETPLCQTVLRAINGPVVSLKDAHTAALKPRISHSCYI